MRATIPAGSDSRLIVVGDLHGQLTDLVTIFGQYGYPSETNVYVFNGDYVDRGPHGLERCICEGYDFREQVVNRYSSCEFDLACKTFKYLPLVTLVNDVICVLHGGLPDVALTIDQISRLRRMNPHADDSEDAYLIKCLLWGDPQDLNGAVLSCRGAGWNFGPDKDDGYEWAHGNRLVTVFSASNYCGSSDNRGAVVVFPSAQWAGVSHAAWRDALPGAFSYYAAAFKGLGDKCKLQTIEMIRKELFMTRHRLIAAFTESPSEDAGTISVRDFTVAMHDVISPELRWEVLWPYFAKDCDGRIQYMSFLEQYRIMPKGTFWIEWARDIVGRVCCKMQETKDELKQGTCPHPPPEVSTFEEIDKDGSGTISYKEFTQALERFDLSLTSEQIYDLFHSIDGDQNGQISYDEFEDYFEAVFTRQKSLKATARAAQAREGGAGDEGEAFAASIVTDIARVLKAHEMQVKRLFRKMDVDMSNTVSVTEFRVGMKIVSKLLPQPLSEDQITQLFQLIDKDKSGSISIDELLEGFTCQ
eukprot:m51a1_g12652 hypothetical protein (530) ;mRNA; f:420-2823